ncbi:MAG TPA: hypothetical protein VNK70_00790 [Candidatus Paceibacterota bacterium]|nr:hypothetical protein [Candidatus Paceibacterota bacterium]
MAIVVQEEKKGTNWVAILSTLVIIFAIFAGAYYLFFKKPELIEVVTPGSLQNVSNISKISFDPQAVLNSPTWKILRQYGSTPTIPSPGRSNPFKPF